VRTRRVVVIDVTGLEAVDLETVDALARVALVVRRCGADARVVGAGLALDGLLRLCGLAEALGIDPVAVEPGRQPEQREEAGGVQEEGDAGDLRTIGLEDLE
jgi:hypothetical protein